MVSAEGPEVLSVMTAPTVKPVDWLLMTISLPAPDLRLAPTPPVMEEPAPVEVTRMPPAVTVLAPLVFKATLPLAALNRRVLIVKAAGESAVVTSVSKEAAKRSV